MIYPGFERPESGKQTYWLLYSPAVTNDSLLTVKTGLRHFYHRYWEFQ